MSPATKETIYVGCDPGLIDPCCAIITDKFMPISFKPNTKPYKDHDTYYRAFEIGKVMANFVYTNWHNCDVVLGIEGASYGSNSSSMEQMALCRQGIFDAFYVRFSNRLVYWQSIAPVTAKKAISGKGNATKEEVIDCAKLLAPNYFMTDKWRNIKRKDGSTEQELNKNTMAMADSLAIAMAIRNKFKESGVKNGQAQEETSSKKKGR